MSGWASTPIYYVAMGFLCGVVGFRLGWRLPGRVALPLLQGTFGFFAFAASWRVVGPHRAALAELGWVLGTTVVALYVFRAEPAHVDERVWRAATYRREMLRWLRSGHGPESRPSATVVRHLAELAIYLAAALVSGNLLALMLGAVLLNYMNAYVARLLSVAKNGWSVGALAWNVWSIVRVAAYVALGVAATAPLAARWGYPALPGAVDPYWIAGGIGVLLDLLLKLSLSKVCGRRLRAALDWDRLATEDG